MKSHRPLVAALAGASLLATAGCSALVDYGEGITMRLSLNQTETHPSFIALEQFGVGFQQVLKNATLERQEHRTEQMGIEPRQLLQRRVGAQRRARRRLRGRRGLAFGTGAITTVAASATPRPA